MKKQIIQHLLENQGFVSVQQLCILLKQPQHAVYSELLQINNAFPGMLVLLRHEKGIAHVRVKIANYADDMAKKIIEDADNLGR